MKRKLQTLTYVEPGAMLDEIKDDITAILQKPDMVTHLSGKEKKLVKEKYQAGFLAWMFKGMMGDQAFVTVAMAAEEYSEFDCAIKGTVKEDVIYRLVQLKELPPDQLNSNETVQALIDKLSLKRGTAPDLIVGIWLNRDMQFHLEELHFDKTKIGQFWFFGDSGTGVLTVEGGPTESLIEGLCLRGRMENNKPEGKTVRFKREPQ